MKSPFRSLFSACLLLAAGLGAAGVHAADYAVRQRIALGDASRWDYLDVDPVRHRLFLTRGDRVQVLDLPSGAVAGEIGGTAGVHGVAFAQDLKTGYTSNGRADSVTVFDLDTLRVKQVVKVPGSNPDAILYEPQSHKLYTFNGKSKDVTVFDAPSMRVLQTIAVGGKPEFAVADGAGHVFVNIEDKSEIALIDVASNTLAATWRLAGCVDPTGIALDRAHARLFSVCQNKVMAVTDAATGRRVASVAIGEHPDAAYYDAATATVFSSNGEGTLSVIHQQGPDQYSVATVATEKGARTMAMDPATRTLYLPVLEQKVFTVLVVAP